MLLSASAPFFIADIVSAFRFALSSVFTCISSWRRVPERRSMSTSCIFLRFSAAVAAIRRADVCTSRYYRARDRESRTKRQRTLLVLLRRREGHAPALFETALARAVFISASIFVCRFASFFSSICSC